MDILSQVSQFVINRWQNEAKFDETNTLRRAKPLLTKHSLPFQSKIGKMVVVIMSNITKLNHWTMVVTTLRQIRRSHHYLHLFWHTAVSCSRRTDDRFVH